MNIGEMVGNDILIYLSGTTGWQPTAMSSSASLDVQRDTIEISHKGSGKWKESLVAQIAWTVSSDGVSHYSDTYNVSGKTQYDLFNLLVSGTTVKIKIAGRSDGIYSSEASGDKYYEGEGIITSISQSFPTNDVATYSVTIQGTGELLIKTVGS